MSIKIHNLKNQRLFFFFHFTNSFLLYQDNKSLTSIWLDTKYALYALNTLITFYLIWLGWHSRPCLIMHESKAPFEVHQENDEELLSGCSLQGQEIGKGNDSCRGK